MQHWVFLETLSALSEDPRISDLAFVDAYAMAPLAEGPTRPDKRFLAVRDAKRSDASRYMKLWGGLVGTRRDRYPSTAAFACAAWPRRVFLELCESDQATYAQIERWSRSSGAAGTIRLHLGDWRSHFRGGLVERGDLTFVSFDPNAYGLRGRSKKSEIMGPADLRVLIDATQDFGRPLLVQISTYSANGGNRMSDVLQSWRDALVGNKFVSAAVVNVNGHNMSAVFARGLPDNLRSAVESRVGTELFNGWLALAATKAGQR